MLNHMLKLFSVSVAIILLTINSSCISKDKNKNDPILNTLNLYHEALSRLDMEKFNEVAYFRCSTLSELKTRREDFPNYYQIKGFVTSQSDLDMYLNGEIRDSWDPETNALLKVGCNFKVGDKIEDGEFIFWFVKDKGTWKVRSRTLSTAVRIKSKWDQSVFLSSNNAVHTQIKWPNLHDGEKYETDFELYAESARKVAINSNTEIFVGFYSNATQEQFQKYEGIYPIKLIYENPPSEVNTLYGGFLGCKPIDGKIEVTVSNDSQDNFKIVIYTKNKN